MSRSGKTTSKSEPKKQIHSSASFLHFQHLYTEQWHMLKMVEPQDGNDWVSVSWLGRGKPHAKQKLSFGPLQEWQINFYDVQDIVYVQVYLLLHNGHLNNTKVVFGKWSASTDFTHPSSSLKISYWIWPLSSHKRRVQELNTGIGCREDFFFFCKKFYSLEI